MLEILGRQLRQFSPGTKVAVVYLSRGLPWGAPHAESPFESPVIFKGAFSSPNQLHREVYHENVFLNFLAFKIAARAKFEPLYELVFERKGTEQAHEDFLLSNFVAYECEVSESK